MKQKAKEAHDERKLGGIQDVLELFTKEVRPTVRTLRAWVASGKIPSVQPFGKGGRVYFDLPEVRASLAKKSANHEAA